MESSDTTNFQLNKNCMIGLPFDRYEKNFTFIVNGKRFETNRIVADILSPTIRKMHFIDSSVDEFRIESNNIIFDDFINLTTFNNIAINSQQTELFSEYFYKLGNIDEYIILQRRYLLGITIQNVIGRLLSIIEMKNSINGEIDFNSELMKKIINFIALNFESIDKNDLKKLNIEVVEKICTNDSLSLYNEDSLLQFVLYLYNDDQSYAPLFEFIMFENVSEDIFSLFKNTFNISDLNNSIWKSICSRFNLISEKNKKEDTNNDKIITSLRHYIVIKDFKYQKGKEFQGIMNYLSIKTGGNIHDNGIIKITSNSINYKEQSPKNLVDYQDDNYYCSTDEGNAFINFDFKDKSIQLRNYCIESRNHSENNGHLKNWVIEVSDDGELWKEKDRHIDDPILNHKSIIAVFDVDQDNNFYRFIRLRQTGNSWSKYGKHNRIYFSFIEFFGKIKMI